MFKFFIAEASGKRSSYAAESFWDAVAMAQKEILVISGGEFHEELVRFLFSAKKDEHIALGGVSLILDDVPVRALSVAITEVTYDKEYFSCVCCKSSLPEIMEGIRKYFEEEASERELDFDIDWAELEEDIAFGNCQNVPYVIRAKDHDSDFVISSEVVTL